MIKMSDTQKIKIEIEIEFSGKAKYVAVDEDGELVATSHPIFPHSSTAFGCWINYQSRENLEPSPRIVNWKDTLVEIKEEGK